MKKTSVALIAVTGLILCINFSCGQRPESSLNEPKIILTPAPSQNVRINGAKIFGVRPGSPFLFKIPATGKKPMKYEVINIPEGLACNPENGMITGTINMKGEYLTTSGSPMNSDQLTGSLR